MQLRRDDTGGGEMGLWSDEMNMCEVKLWYERNDAEKGEMGMRERG